MKKNWTIRLLAGVAAGAMAFSMVGCGSSKDNSKDGGKEKFIVGFDAAFPPYEVCETGTGSQPVRQGVRGLSLGVAESELHMDHSGGRGADRRGSALPLPQQKEEKEPAEESG